MNKLLIGIIAGATIVGMTGCTCNYNDVYYNSQTYHYYPERRVTIRYRHEGFPETYHLPEAPKNRKTVEPIDASTSKIIENAKRAAKAKKRMNHAGKLVVVCDKCGRSHKCCEK